MVLRGIIPFVLLSKHMIFNFPTLTVWQPWNSWRGQCYKYSRIFGLLHQNKFLLSSLQYKLWCPTIGKLILLKRTKKGLEIYCWNCLWVTKCNGMIPPAIFTLRELPIVLNFYVNSWRRITNGPENIKVEQSSNNIKMKFLVHSLQLFKLLAKRFQKSNKVSWKRSSESN